jgi:hypothetical protein
MEQKILREKYMNHSVTIHPDGYIVFKKDGDFNLSEAKILLEQLITACNQLRKSGKPVLILGELVANGGFEVEARNLFSDNVNQIDFDKIAAFSDNTIIKTLVNFFLMVGGEQILQGGRQVKFFTKRDEAVDWLLS